MGLLEWGDMYKRTNALGFTSSEDAVYQPPRLASFQSPSYNIREELFETDEDIYFEMVGKDFEAAAVSSVYPAYTPSHQKSSLGTDLPAIGEDDNEEIYFPSYDDVECSDTVECVESATESPQSPERPISPDPVERPEDDSAIRVQPSRHVDYLSHDWTEEDITASWKHIVSKRGAYSNSARLENASWRSWAKKRSNLKTVPPETVKWMKDHDLTWLYGPLTPAPTSFETSHIPMNKGRRLSRAEIARHSKKPILKKRSLSEIMLRRSISSTLLLKQGVVAKMGRDGSQSAIYESPELTRANTDITSSKSTCGLGDSSDGWKKVQFHELVEQCIALANAGEEDNEYQYCSDSEEDMIVMRKAKKRATSKWMPSIKPKAKKPISKTITIEKLPHAPLKDNEVLEDVPEEDILEEISDSESVSPSSQMYTSGSSSLGHENDDEEEEDMDWEPPAWLQGRKDSVQLVKDRISDIKMHEDEVAQEAKPPNRPQLERRDASATQEALSVPVAPQKEGMDASIKFELPPARPQLSGFSFKTPKYQRPRDDYFMVDPGMTEGESEDSVEVARAASQSSEAPERNQPKLALDNFQRLMVDRVMSEFWALFNQQWDSYSQGSVLSPLSPTGPITPISIGKRRRGAGRRQRTEKSSYFESLPENGLTSPDSKDLADYECYLHRELPREVHRSVEAAVRRDSQPKEAQLVGNLVNIIHDCEDAIFQSYFEETDRVMRGLGILSMDPSQAPSQPKAEHQRSELLNAAFHQPPLQYNSAHRASLRSSGLSDAQSPSSATPTTPRDRIFSDSGYASEIASSTTSSMPSRRDTDSSKWSLPKDVKDKNGRSIREMDLNDYDAVDEALAWASVC